MTAVLDETLLERPRAALAPRDHEGHIDALVHHLAADAHDLRAQHHGGRVRLLSRDRLAEQLDRLLGQHAAEDLAHLFGLAAFRIGVGHACRMCSPVDAADGR